MAGPNWHLADDRKTVTVSFPSDPPVALKLESRDNEGLLGKLFGKGMVVGALLAVFLIGGTAWAVQPGTIYAIFGSGSKSCGSWLEAKERDRNTRQIFHEWLNGYRTAYSLWMERGSGPVTKGDNAGAWAWIDSYCQEHPLKDVAYATEALIYATEAN